jgi:hypothetical protein
VEKRQVKEWSRAVLRTHEGMGGFEDDSGLEFGGVEGVFSIPGTRSRPHIELMARSQRRMQVSLCLVKHGQYGRQ